MVSKSKNSYIPNFVSPPGDTLLEIINDRSISQADLARRMGRPKKTINEIIQGKTSITSETALQLEKVLGASAGFWLNRQKHYDEYLAKKTERDQLSNLSEWVERLPVKRMIELGWIEKKDDNVHKVVEILRFFGVASPEQWDLIAKKTVAAFRLAKKFDSSTEDITAWLRK